MSSKQLVPPVKLVLISHGLKRFGIVGEMGNEFGVVPKADFYIDCRGIKEHGKGVNRNHYPSFSEAIKKSCPDTLQAMVTQITDGLRQLPLRRLEVSDPYAEPYTICFMCAWGLNRSPTTKHIIGDQLRELGYNVEIRGEEWEKT